MRKDDSAVANGAPIWQRYFYYFLIGCVVGYAYEYLLLTFYYRTQFVNHGPLHGPLLLIYGIGGLLLVVLLSRLTRRKLQVGKVNLMPLGIAALIALIVSGVEFTGHWVAETFYNQRLWDYSDKFMNLQGRICLEDTLRFVILGLIMLYLIVPVLEWLLKKMSRRQNWVLFGIMATAFGVDIVLSISYPLG